jgi:hypothetical protein
MADHMDGNLCTIDINDQLQGIGNMPRASLPLRVVEMPRYEASMVPQETSGIAYASADISANLSRSETMKTQTHVCL